MKLYISGPMTGLSEFNLPAFAAAELELGSIGYDALNPGRHGADPAFSWADYLRRDLIDLLACEGVALLNGWENSRGAKLEVHVAKALSMPVEPITYWIDRAFAA